MRYQTLLITSALLPLLACGGGGSTTAPEASSGAQGVSPGASTSSPAHSSALATDPATEAASMIVDLESHRIFLPDEGWLTAEAFWDLYYNHAERLPGNIDFDAVNQLGPMPPAPAAQP